MSLFEEVKAISVRAKEKAKKQAIADQRAKTLAWHQTECKKAAEIIKELPGQIKEWASEHHEPDDDGTGPTSFRVMYLGYDQYSGEVPRLNNLKGAPAIVRDWCLKQGFKVKVTCYIDHGSDSQSSQLIVLW